MCSARRPVTPENLARGAIPCTLTPFDEAGSVMWHSITDQARRLARIKGVVGIAVNTTTRERLTLTPDERLEVIRCTRKGLVDHQILISCVGNISDQAAGDVIASGKAGANAIVAFPAKWQTGVKGQKSRPVIVTPGHGSAHQTASSEGVEILARTSGNMIAFDVGSVDHDISFCQDYYVIGPMDQIFACPRSFEAALLKNLNAGSDGAFASLACIAPHEVASLYAASRKGQTHNCRALQHRLFPLIQFFSEHEQNMREVIYREAATYRGVLTTPYARDLNGDLCPDLKCQLHRIIDESGFKPVSWI